MKNPVGGGRRAVVAICCVIALGGCASCPGYVSDTLAAQGARRDGRMPPGRDRSILSADSGPVRFANPAVEQFRVVQR